MIRHVPNALTILRLVSVPATIWMMATGREAGAFWLFAAAGLTDAVDGAIARMFDAKSRLGMVLDPLADKVLLVSIYVTLGIQGHIPLWLVVLVVLRDVVIVLYALVYVLAGAPTGTPLFISKINTAMQIALAGLVLAWTGLGIGGPLWVDAAIYAVAATTIASAAAYLFSVSRRVPAVDR